ncbi:MAG: amidohydrolase family protein [Thermomicrobiales bacterium]|nr:amidohydrolase family protein [Thermomicrobiales bacterium]
MAEHDLVAVIGSGVLDGTGAPAQRGVAVLVRDAHIVALLPEAQVPAGADRIELRGMHLLPGLIDAHVHLLGQRSMDNATMTFAGEGLRAARATADLGRLLQAGITTVRDCGSYTALALKAALGEGSIAGPRVVPCGRFIERTGGADDAPDMPLAWAQEAGPWAPRLADGADDVRKAVREQLRGGAEWIKTCTTGALTTQVLSNPDILEWSDPEIQAITDEAHRLGARVAVHAHAKTGIVQALDAGADSIEHGTCLDDETAKRMADAGVWLVPTLFVLTQIIEHGAEFGTPDWVLAKAREVMEARQRSMEAALRHQVPVAMGTDIGGQNLLPHGRNAAELALLVRFGMSAADALVAGTLGAARCLGLQDERGSLEAGKVADIIAVPGDPLQDISVTERVAFVMQNGRVVKHALPVAV